MAFTLGQLQELEKSIAEGVLTTKYEDRLTTFRSLDEMQRLRRLMLKELGLIKSDLKRTRVATNKDLS